MNLVTGKGGFDLLSKEVRKRVDSDLGVVDLWAMKQKTEMPFLTDFKTPCIDLSGIEEELIVTIKTFILMTHSGKKESELSELINNVFGIEIIQAIEIINQVKKLHKLNLAPDTDLDFTFRFPTPQGKGLYSQLNSGHKHVHNPSVFNLKTITDAIKDLYKNKKIK